MLRFVADSMLGRLARWLRALGYDVYYDPRLDDHGVVAQARGRGALALTRDTRFPKPPDVRIMHIASDHLQQQIEQVIREAPLDPTASRPLSRCTECNTALESATRDDVWDRVPPFVYLTVEVYSRCSGCGRVYWEGTHTPRIRAQLDRLTAAAGKRRIE